MTDKEVEFKKAVADIMRKDGATEEYIEKYLTDTVVINAIVNDCSPDDCAWGLLF